MANDVKTPPSNEASPETSSTAPAEPPSPEERLAQLTRERDELHDRLLRTAAEFDNWKKRAKKEVDDAQSRGRETLLKELLPVFDNLERALKHAAADDPLATGVQMVEKQLMSVLDKVGVTRFSAVGQPFDPTIHDAIQQVETDEFPAGIVAVEFASGYRAGNRLIRPAMVGVAKAPPTAEPPSPDGSA
jgi:molecular chaperone GrpE